MNVNRLLVRVVSCTIRCLVLMVVAFLLFHGGRKAYAFGKAVFVDAPMTGEENAREITVTIPDGASAKDIGEILERKNLIRDSMVFYVQTFCVEEGSKLKGGRYDLDTSMSAAEMMEIMAAANEEEKDGE